MCNILQKINQKLGGTNQMVAKNSKPASAEESYWSLMEQGSCMVVGGGVQRPAVGLGASRLSPAIASLVGSMDIRCGQWAHSISAQDPTHFNILPENFQSMFGRILDASMKMSKTGKVPAKIIYFRDNLSDRQFDLAKEEVSAIKAEFARRGAPKPLVTLVAAQKNHSTRFFPPGVQANDRANPPPGFLLDSSLCHNSTYMNFYLLSHAGIIGTSHPTRYFVLWDDMKMAKNQLYQFVYNMCFLFGRCTRSCSLPAPLMYTNVMADKAWKMVTHSKLLAGFDEVSFASNMSEEEKTRIMTRQVEKNVEICNNCFRDSALNVSKMYYC
eukprot:GHVS01049257.1.p1 GENE.GHVS01049257.1~~GHVS01049257.1.p1  ORF type:complete len:327 (+),score=28.35 GHVS01049257.1:174-1154(+)